MICPPKKAASFGLNEFLRKSIFGGNTQILFISFGKPEIRPLFLSIWDKTSGRILQIINEAEAKMGVRGRGKMGHNKVLILARLTGFLDLLRWLNDALRVIFKIALHGRMGGFVRRPLMMFYASNNQCYVRQNDWEKGIGSPTFVFVV